MSPASVLKNLETERLLLRRQRVEDAPVFHRLWTERDARVPPHRRVGPDGRPTESDVATHIRAQLDDTGPGLLTVSAESEHGRSLLTVRDLHRRQRAPGRRY